MEAVLIVMFVAILASLAVGLWFLLKSQGRSKGLVSALTVRIALSVLLFVVLMAAWYFGLIEPHGLQPLPPSE